MELNLGIEPRDEYLSYELFKGALNLVRDVMLSKPGENVLITGDTSTDRRVMEACAGAAHAIGAIPTVITYVTAPGTVIDPPAPIAAAACKADVWIELTFQTVMHSLSWQAAIASGVRYICLTGMDVEMIVKTIARVDYATMIELGEHFKARMEQADKIEVKSETGTNLVAFHQGRKVRHSGQLATQKAYPVMLGGQISWCPIEASIEGDLVFDGALWPPQEIGLLKTPIHLKLEKGTVTAVTGGAEAMKFKNWLESYQDPASYRLAHYSLGFNPGVTKATGRIVEDERVFGCMEFGIGSQGKAIMGECWNAPSHTDGILLKPTIILDGEVFEQDGIYQDPIARALCKKLGVAGY